VASPGLGFKDVRLQIEHRACRWFVQSCREPWKGLAKRNVSQSKVSWVISSLGRPKERPDPKKPTALRGVAASQVGSSEAGTSIRCTVLSQLSRGTTGSEGKSGDLPW